MKVERKMLKMLAVVVGVALLAQVVPAGADTVTVGYDHDGAIMVKTTGGLVGKNTGGLWTGMYQSGSSYYLQRSLIAFDLSDLTADGYVAGTHQIDSITLRLLVYQGGYDGPENTTTVYAVSQSAGAWDFGTMTGNDLWTVSDTIDPSALGSHTFPADQADDESGTYIEITLDGNAIDLTGMVNGWFTTNTGLGLRGYEGSPLALPRMKYDINSPELVVSYSAIPEPATMAMLGLGGVVMLLRRRKVA